MESWMGRQQIQVCQRAAADSCKEWGGSGVGSRAVAELGRECGGGVREGSVGMEV